MSTRQALKKTSETDVLIDSYGIFLIAQLESREETKEIREAFEKIQQDLEERKGETRKSIQNIFRAKAAKSQAYRSLLEKVRNFHRDILKVTGDDRHSSLYQSYFPQGLRHITQATQSDLFSRLERVMARLKEEKDESLAGHYSSLQTALQSFKGALERLEEAYLTYQNAFSLELAGREEWHKAYNLCKAELLILFKGNKKRVEEFFLKGKKKKKKDNSEEDQPQVEGSGKLIVAS